ncbi:PAS domain S-box protein [Phormidium sp. CCY1219]|uniref:PAS domain S-box protein n=1 Tax=Phormidium sp. CCY1219 TaxID=2886104 RepID=UPI002D1F818F|nr:PAS domain S-box protein [Phormidium sp. CCY1219]MEB3830064.1 PAS domain S-box protein [Phormidium sp. CCY1219]
MKLKSQILSAFLAVACLFAISGAINIQQERRVKHQFDRIARTKTGTLLVLEEMKVSSLQVMTEILRDALGGWQPAEGSASGDRTLLPAEPQASLKDPLAEAKASSERGLEYLLNIPSNPLTRQRYEDIKQAHDAFYQTARELIELNRNGATGEAIRSKGRELEEKQQELLALIQDWIAVERQRLAGEISRAENRADVSIWISIFSSLVACAIAIGTGVLLAEKITRPLIEIKDKAVKIGQGQLDEAKLNTKCNNELGVLATAFNQMVDNLKQTTVSKVYLDNLIKHLSESLIVLNPENGTIKDFNLATFYLLEYEESELIGKPIQELFGEKNIGDFLEINELARTSLVGRKETKLLAKNGRHIPVSFSASVMRDREGNLQGIICLAQDISARKRAEAALRESQERIDNILSSLQDIVWSIDAKTFQMLYVNPPAEAVYGRSLADFFQRPTLWLETIHPEDREFVKNSLHSLFEVESQDMEYRILRPDGEVRWLRVRCRPIQDVTGMAVRIDGITTDITERKRGEEESQKLALLVENSNDFICMADLAGNIIFLNAAGKRLVGLENGAGNAVAHLAHYHPELTWNLLRDTAIPTVVECGNWDGEGQLRHFQTEDAIDVSIDCFAIQYAPNGEIETFAAVMRDITERKRYEAAIERERQQLQQIVTHAPVAMAMFDSQLCYIAHSQRWLRDYKFPHSSLIGMKLYDAIPDFPPRWKPLVERALQGEVIAHPEDVWQREDGTKLYLSWAIQPWFESEKPLSGTETSTAEETTVGGIAIVSNIINELVETREQAIEAAKMKSQFLANMSHEIRTPMNGVLGTIELLMKTPLNHQQMDFTHTLLLSAENLLTIINDILDFSKLEAGEMRLSVEEFELMACLEEVVDLFASQAERKNLNFALIVEPEVPRHLLGDPSRLRQILSNLVGNAMKFTEGGEVAIFVSRDRASASSLPREYSPNPSSTANDLPPIPIRFIVKDTGIGISPENQKKLFQSFSQVDPSTTKKYGGTGLGLVICKQLVQLMGGEIGLDSEEGVGSQFWFTAILGQVGDRYPEFPSMPGVRETLCGKKLLVMDSHLTNRTVVQFSAQMWGINVEETDSSISALTRLCSAAKTTPYDVALLDFDELHPNPNILGQLIRLKPVLERTKLVLMISLGQVNRAQKLLEFGFAGYLIKPVKERRVLDCLASVLCDRASTVSGQSSAILYPDQPSSDRTPLPSAIDILLVEDTPINQKVLLNQLDVLGLQANCANNGREALDKLQEREYDIVFMDCQMPILDGYDATKALRNREANSQRHTTIVGLTAYAMKGDREKCLAAGMDDYLSKPVSLEDLETTIRRWVTDIGDRIPTGENPPATVQNPSTLDPQPTIAAVDGDRLHQISRGDAEFARELLSTFANDACTYIAQAWQALESQDTQTLARKAHQLKGASGTVAVRFIPEIASQLEAQAKSERLEDARELLASLQEIFERFTADMDNWESPGDRQAPENRADPETRQTQSSPGAIVEPLPVNLDRLNQISRGDRAFAVELLAAFVADARTYIAQAQEALAAQDTTTLAHKAHQLKGGSATVAVLEMPEIAASLERDAKNERLENAEKILDRLEAIVAQIEAFIQSRDRRSAPLD